MVEGSDLFKGSTKRLIKYSGKFSNLVCSSGLASFYLPPGRPPTAAFLPTCPGRQLSGPACWAGFLRLILHSPSTLMPLPLYSSVQHAPSLCVPPSSKPLHPSPSPSSSGLLVHREQIFLTSACPPLPPSTP